MREQTTREYVFIKTKTKFSNKSESTFYLTNFNNTFRDDSSIIIIIFEF